MTLAQVVDADLAPATAKRARQLDSLVQAAKAAVAQALDKWAQRVAEAYLEQIHLALGYDNWEDYADERCRIDFGNVADRQRAVGMLTGEGLSSRAIGAVTGVSWVTVTRDQQSEVLHDVTPDEPVTGTDGKTYRRKPPREESEYEVEQEEGNPLQLGTELKLLKSLKGWLRSTFRADQIDRYSPETKQLFIDTLRRTATKLEKSL